MDESVVDSRSLSLYNEESGEKYHCSYTVGLYLIGKTFSLRVRLEKWVWYTRVFSKPTFWDWENFKTVKHNVMISVDIRKC